MNRHVWHRAAVLLVFLTATQGCTVFGLGWDGRGNVSKSMRDTVLDLGTTPVLDMPTTGYAVFNGYMNASVDNDSKMIGDVVMTADFAGGRVTGTVRNVNDVDGILVIGLGGNLQLGETNSYISGNTFRTSLTGTLRNGGDISYNWIFSATASGAFYGEEAEAALATISGRVTDTFIWPTSHELSGFIVAKQ